MERAPLSYSARQSAKWGPLQRERGVQWRGGQAGEPPKGKSRDRQQCEGDAHTALLLQCLQIKIDCSSRQAAHCFS